MDVNLVAPSDSLIYRCWQMVPDFIHVITALFQKVVPSSPTVEEVKTKLENYEKYFESKGVVKISNPLTPQELRLLVKDERFEALKESPGAIRLRQEILNSLPEGVSVFITSRSTVRLAENRRFSLAEIFRYLGGRDLKHVGFLIKTGNKLQVSHIERDRHVVLEGRDPLTFAHIFIVKVDVAPFFSDEKKGAMQRLFDETLGTEALRERGNVPNMGGWVFLPFFFGHKRVCSSGSYEKVLIESGKREMCSSFVAKVLLLSLKTLGVPYPIAKNEILERIHIVRLLRLFQPYLKPVPFNSLLANALPSPTSYIGRFWNQ